MKEKNNFHFYIQWRSPVFSLHKPRKLAANPMCALQFFPLNAYVKEIINHLKNKGTPPFRFVVNIFFLSVQVAAGKNYYRFDTPEKEEEKNYFFNNLFIPTPCPIGPKSCNSSGFDFCREYARKWWNTYKVIYFYFCENIDFERIMLIYRETMIECTVHNIRSSSNATHWQC